MATTSGGEPFCASPLWDLNLTWNVTEHPDFTPCFHHTVLAYVPAAVLVLFTPLQLYWVCTSRDRGIKPSWLTWFRMVVNLLAILIPLTNYMSSDVTFVDTAAKLSPAVQAIGAGLGLGLHLMCLRGGLVTSGPIWIYWFINVVAQAFTFASVVQGSPTTLAAKSEFTVYVVILNFAAIVAMLILSSWADPPPKYTFLDNDKPNLTPEKYASFPSKICFAWFDPLAWKGWKTVLSVDELWDLDYLNRSAGVVPIWDKYWEMQKKSVESETTGAPIKSSMKSSNQQARKKLSIVSTLFQSFGPAFAVSGVLQLLYSVLQFVSPQIVNLLINFVQSDDPDWKGYLYMGLIVGVTLINTLINSQTFYIQYIVGLRIKTALISAIYRKSLRLSNVGRKEMSVGETTNLMSIDTQKFMDLLLFLNMIWASPLQIALAVYFLWQILGPSALAGLAVMVIMIPANAWVSQKMKKYQIAQMKCKDKRTVLMDEILSGIKVIKLYAWEKIMRKKVTDVRAEEMSALIKAAYMNSFTTFLWTSAPFLVALASFATFVLSDPNNVLDASTAFVSLTLFNLLRIPLNMLPMLIVYMVQCKVSVDRINTFMNADELDEDSVSHNHNEKYPIHMENATFAWSRNSEPAINNIDFKVKEGQLVAVVGQVGSGKSSLISAILGEMHKINGGINNSTGKIAYVPQQAWMQNTTLKENITFGKPWNKNLYKKVIDGCSLKPDLEVLPAGDATEIGEKGINLSGGQKQRISMARSIYSNGDVYLLDDPLSAVDAHVGKHIFDHVIGPEGLLKNKTVVLVTHGVGYLKQMDNIVVLKDGRISEQGSYEELMLAGGAFADFLVQHLNEALEDEDLDPDTESDMEELKENLESVLGKSRLKKKLDEAKSLTPRSSLAPSETVSERVKDTTLGRKPSRGVSGIWSSKTGATGVSAATNSTAAARKKIRGEKLIEDEKAAIGGVKWGVYYGYAKSIGLAFTVMSISMYAIYQGFGLGSNIWLSNWSVDPLATTDISVRNKYLAVYGVLGLLQATFVMIATATIQVGSLKASSKLHHGMLDGIMHSTMAFFDTTPLGRILNRFGKDIDVLDITVPMNTRMLLVQFFNVAGTLVVICVANPVFIVVVVPIMALYYFVQKFYVTTARQVKRLESITRSPIYSHFSATITGAPTLRAFDVLDNFTSESDRKVDVNQTCYYPTFVSSRWLSVRLETIGNLVILFASLFAVLFRNKMDPGKVGLSLSYALNITGMMNMLVRMTSEIETNMVSAERIMEYQETPQEAPYEVEGTNVPKEWPQYGVVKFDHYKTRYREGLDLVLKDIDFESMSGEKIGIVGRTGAGKSSLTLSLFRIIEAAGGSIYIDGENIAFMGLETLRSRLTIIPQDPFLFSATMRLNLDPFEKYSDKQMWEALDVAHLKSFIASLPGGLNFQVNEGGENLSVGQRQLVCLARAVLRKTKVLVLDEATAAVDLETDELIQRTIRDQFADCTVITIAHRLNTILDSSRVLVLDQGYIKEFETPENLLADRNSQFYSMVQDAGMLNLDGELIVKDK